MYYLDIARKTLVILVAFSLVVIFDKAILDFVFGKQNFLSSFSQYDYSKKEWLIWTLDILLLGYFLLTNYLNKKTTSHLYNYSTIFSDIIFVSLSIYYLIIRNSIFIIGDISYQLAGYSSWGLNYLDIPFAIIFLRSLINIIYCTCKFFRSANLMSSSLWQNDHPQEDLEEGQDIYSRKKLALKIAEQINEFSDKRGSFSIGIVGSWGSGKTSFLYQIKKGLEGLENENKKSKYKQNLVLNFNPWQYPNETNLTQAFLREIEVKLKKHTFLNRHFNDYISQLFKNNRSFWSIFINALLPPRNIEELHQSISTSIIQSKKRLVIFIDDIDRLQSHEVYEILTIIRNIGNLPNLIFVLAYDKEYLVKILTDTVEDSQQFLSKFFQAEYALSKIPKDSITTELISQIEKAFPNLMPINSHPSSQNADKFITIEKLIQNLVGVQLLKNQRDIVRLMNSLIINWKIVDGEVLFEDYLKLEILRLKYENVYSRIKFRDVKFISQREGSLVFGIKNFNPLNGKVESVTKEELLKLFDNFITDDNEKNVVINILKSLFPNPEEQYEPPHTYSEVTDGEKLKAVKNVLRFDLYFQNDVVGFSFNEINKLRENG